MEERLSRRTVDVHLQACWYVCHLVVATTAGGVWHFKILAHPPHLSPVLAVCGLGTTNDYSKVGAQKAAWGGKLRTLMLADLSAQYNASCSHAAC